jgi:ATP-dependent helicase HrpA
MSRTIDQVQIRHLGKIFSLQASIRKRQAKKLPIDQLNAKLETLIDQSTKQTQSNHNQFKKITLQDDLPITQKSETITKLLNDNQVIIVAGETGCGKTTQLPKICMQAGYGARGFIAHTQPRRVAATSVAKRIADEIDTPLGETVGYSVRFNNKLSHNTRLKIMTDGILLAELETDPLLSKYEVIIIDEAHERSLNIDFLLGFLKNILAKRKELKLIITSATIDPMRFSRHFDDAPTVLVEGRTYPVEVRYRPIEDTDNQQELEPILNAVLAGVDECIAESVGDILIFADGEGQIKSIVKQLQQANLANTLVLPLYARLSIKEQQKIFASSQQRKIIVSTNVAETSLTVPGIIFVIDIGNARISRFSQRNKIQQLPVEKVSKASSEQRKGRCGRVAPGICIRLYSEQDFELRDEFTCAEIQRTNLSSVALKLKSLGINEVDHFPFIEPPDERAWKTAFNSLFELGAVDKQQAITKIGQQMTRLPVDPQLARILVQPDLTAVNEMLIICSLMSVREVRERPIDKQQKSDQAHQVYNKNDSDILTAIELWHQLEQQKQDLSSNAFKQWCSKHFINFLGWLEWRKVYFQLKEAVESLGIKVNTSAVHDDDVHRGLVPGFITHIFCKSLEKHYQGVRNLKVWLHPSSLLFKKSKPWLLSAEMIETEKLYARMNCAIQPEWIEQTAEHLLKSHYQDIHWRKKNGQVMALLNQTFLGLPVVNQRLVNYANVDQSHCRKLFLSEALAGDQLNEDFSFLKHNRKNLQALEEQEKRQRLNNIRIDQPALAELYDQVVPENIISFASLKRWLKKDLKKHNQLLSFSLEQLTVNASQQIDDYPNSINVKGVDLNLTYCFAPGTDQDGVSVEIPQSMLNQFNDRDFDWLVPGYLEEKVLACLKSLAKPIRRELIPLNNTAQKLTQTLLQQGQLNKVFITQLAKSVQRLMGRPIKETDFDLDNIPKHLMMKYNIKQKNQSLSIESLNQFKFKQVDKTSLLATDSSLKRYTDWQFESFVIEQINTDNSQVNRVFQGLTDDQQSVVIKHYPSINLAFNANCQGIARLIMLKNSGLLNQFFNSWPDKKYLEMLSIRFDGFKPLFESVVIKWLISMIKQTIKKQVIKTDNSNNIITTELFSQFNQNFNQNFRKQLSQDLNAILSVVKQRESLFAELAALNAKVFKTSIEDIKQQLHILWSKDVLIKADSDVYFDYKRLQQAISVRITRIQSNYPKEQQALETWLEWFEWYVELQQEPQITEIVDEFDKLFWLLEEYRISLFSPGVKTKGSISAKKLQKAFEAIEAKIV